LRLCRLACTAETRNGRTTALLNQTRTQRGCELCPSRPDWTCHHQSRCKKDHGSRRYQSAAEMRNDIESVRRETKPRVVEFAQGNGSLQRLFSYRDFMKLATWRFRDRVLAFRQ